VSRPQNRPIESLTSTQIKRFHASYTVSEGCWLWTGYVNEQGCARFKYNDYRFYAARVAYFLATGIDVAQLNINHTCDNPRCMNPVHLWPGTQQANIEDMNRKGRHSKIGPRGERSSAAKLTEQKVRKIRNSDESQGVLAIQFGVSQPLISLIQNRRVWKHVA